LLENYEETDLTGYKSHPYDESVPIKTLETYKMFLTASVAGDAAAAPIIKSPIVDNKDLLEAEQEITKQGELILKLPNNKELPFVSIVTVTYNRKLIFPMAIRNWELFEYPRDKLEWIIVDDSDDGSSLSGILPKSSQIKYYRLQTTGRLSIGQKRNFGVKNATHEYIAFMDDDDYYYPHSIYARISLLLKYPKYDLVGVTDLDIYDVVNDFSARVKGSMISEASMAFRKSFWVEQQFPDKFNTLGEGYPFTKDRRDRIVRMPSCFNIIAMTHWSNYTQGVRSQDNFKNVSKKDNILSVLDLPTKMFIFDLFGRTKVPHNPLLS
jgi:glycosyltransferase involved in cell wall biosynthesis